MQKQVIAQNNTNHNKLRCPTRHSNSE